MSSYLSSPNFSLILSLSVGIYLCSSTPALESKSSPFPSAHLARHLRPGMTLRSTTPPPLHVSQSDTAMLRKSVSFSEELLLVASGRIHPLLSPWPLTLGPVTASGVTTRTLVLLPGRISCHRWINRTNKWICLICPCTSFGKCTLKCTLWWSGVV